MATFCGPRERACERQEGWEMLRRFVETELGRVRDCPQAAMLSDRVFERLDESFTRTAEFVAGDTATHLVAEVPRTDLLGAGQVSFACIDQLREPLRPL